MNTNPKFKVGDIIALNTLQYDAIEGGGPYLINAFEKMVKDNNLMLGRAYRIKEVHPKAFNESGTKKSFICGYLIKEIPTDEQNGSEIGWYFVASRFRLIARNYEPFVEAPITSRLIKHHIRQIKQILTKET